MRTEENVRVLLEQAEAFALPRLYRYYDSGSELFHILLMHSRSVALKALQVLERHPDLEADAVFVAQAALLHDIGIIHCNAPAIACLGTHLYVEHGYLGADMLRAEGLERHACVAERHTGTGITLEQIEARQLPLPMGRIYEPRTMEEKVVCYADKFYSKTHLQQEASLEKICSKLRRFGNDAVIRFEEWHGLFG